MEAPPPAGGATPLTQQDQAFAAIAYATGKAQIEIGRLAERNGNDEIAGHARKIVGQYAKATEELCSIVSASGICSRQALPTNVLETKNELMVAPKHVFNRQYLRWALDDHRRRIALFADQTEAGENTALVQYARDLLPDIHRHAATVGKLLVGLPTTPEETTDLQVGTAHDRAHANLAATRSGYPLADRPVADLIGLQVVTATGNTTGTIKEIVMDVSSGAVIAVVPVGGVLAIGAKDVGVPARDLQTAPPPIRDSALMVTGRDEADLQAMPAFDSTAPRYMRYPDNRRIGDIGVL